MLLVCLRQDDSVIPAEVQYTEQVQKAVVVWIEISIRVRLEFGIPDCIDKLPAFRLCPHDGCGGGRSDQTQGVPEFLISAGGTDNLGKSSIDIKLIFKRIHPSAKKEVLNPSAILLLPRRVLCIP